MKRFVAMLLSLLMLFSILPVTALAEGEGETPSPATPTYVWDKDEDGNPTCTATLETVTETATVENGQITSKVTKAATCSATGTVQYTATFDTSGFDTQTKDYDDPIDADAHKLAHTDAKAATCEEDGNKEYWQCEYCNKYFLTEASTVAADYDTQIKIAKKEHTLVAHKAADATCEQSGNKAYWQCSACKKYYLTEEATSAVTWAEISIPAAHKLVKHDAKEPTCKEKGNKAYWQCSVCNKYFLTEDATQEVSWADDIELAVDATKHAGELKHNVALKATCVEAGCKEYWYCEDCDTCFSDSEGKTKVSKDDLVIPVDENAHQKLDHYEAVSATCTDEGMKEYWYCDGCDTYFSDSEGKTKVSEADLLIPVDTNAHSLIHHDAKEATCGEVGNKEYWQCEHCGKFYLSTDTTVEAQWSEIEIAKVAHKTPLEYHAKVDATCTEAGTKEYWFCADCNTYFADSEGKTVITEESTVIPVDPTAHASKLNHHELAKATCTEAGTKEYWSCADCGNMYLDEEGTIAVSEEGLVIAATGHTNVEYFQPVKATCTTDGHKEYWHCKDCDTYSSNKTFTAIIIGGDDPDIIIPATNHTDTETGETLLTHHDATESTYYVKGNIEYWVCSECGKYYADEECNDERKADKVEPEGILLPYTTVPVPTMELEEVTRGVIKITADNTILPVIDGSAVTNTGFKVFRYVTKDGDKTATLLGYMTKSKSEDEHDYTDKTPVAGVEYTYFIKAYVTDGTNTASSDPSNKEEVIVGPGAISSIKATVSGTTANISWSAAADASGYCVFRSDDPTGSFEQVSTDPVEKTSYADKDLEPGQIYYYRVCAYVKTADETSPAYGPDSQIAEAIVPLTTPVITVTKQDASHITVEWKEIEGAEYYEVNVSGNATSKTKVDAPDLSAALELPPDGTYSITVTACSEAGAKKVSSKASAAKSITLTLAAPVLTAKMETPLSVVLTWTEVPGADAYRVYCYDGGVETLVSEQTDVPCKLPATAGTYHYYTVRAVWYNKEKTTEAPVLSKPSTRKCVSLVFSAPTLTVKKTDTTEIEVKWTKVDGATSYELYRKTNLDSAWSDEPYIAYLTDEDIPFLDETVAGRTYSYKMVAIYDDGLGTVIESKASAIKSVSLPLASPTVTAKKASATKINLTWKAVTGADEYHLYVSTVKNSFPAEYDIISEAPTSDSPYEYENVPGKTYYFKVVSMSAVKGDEQESSKASVKSVTLPFAAPSVKLKKGKDNTVTLSWKPIAGAASYEIYQSKNSKTNFEELDCEMEIGESSCSAVINILPGTTYYFKVRAVSEDFGDGPNYSSYSKIVSVKLAFAAPALTVKRVKGSDMGLELTWKSVAMAESYRVYYRYNDEDWTVLQDVDADAERSVIFDALPGVTYYFKVAGVCTAHGEEAVGSASIKSYTIAFSAPSITLKKNSDGDITVSWKEVNFANYYQIQWSDTKTFSEDESDVFDTSYTLYGQSAGKHYFRVRAVYDADQKSYSSWSKVKYITVK